MNTQTSFSVYSYHLSFLTSRQPGKSQENCPLQDFSCLLWLRDWNVSIDLLGSYVARHLHHTTLFLMYRLWYATASSCFNTLAPLPKYTGHLFPACMLNHGHMHKTHTRTNWAKQIITYQRLQGIKGGSELNKVITCKKLPGACILQCVCVHLCVHVLGKAVCVKDLKSNMQHNYFMWKCIIITQGISDYNKL